MDCSTSESVIAMKTSCYSICLVMLGLTLLAGCGRDTLLDTVSVRGEVTFRGKPLGIGEVRYLPKDAKNGRVARAEIQSNGKFELTTLELGDGVLKGDYRIVVVVYEDQFEDKAARNLRRMNENKTPTVGKPQPPIPKRYYRPETSGLTDKVDDSHSGYKKIELVE